MVMYTINLFQKCKKPVTSSEILYFNIKDVTICSPNQL